VKVFTLLIEVTKLMPVVSSKGFCDALRSIICIASEQQQQLGTVNAAASVQHIHARFMHALCNPMASAQ